jgi:hypothetical protein
MDDYEVGELLGPFTKWLKLRLADMSAPASRARSGASLHLPLDLVL